MRISKRIILFVLTIHLALLGSTLALAGKSFDWMPKGGSELLLNVLKKSGTSDSLADLARAKKSPKEWLDYLARYKDAMGALSEKEKQTLVAYLAARFPITESIPKDLKAIQQGRFLPADGKQLVLEQCQACHSIAVPVQHKLDFTGWKGVVDTGTHANLDIKPQEKEEISRYSSINFPVPENKIPKELQAPLSGY